jgi:hypothetical protein
MEVTMSCEFHSARATNKPQHYSSKIKSIINYIEDVLGYEVIKNAQDLPDNIMGRVSYENRTIKINCACSGCALVALLHEAGHVLHYIECEKKNLGQPKKDVREQEADKRGRDLSILIGFDPEDWCA